MADDERLRLDWHNHTADFSDGTLTVAEVAARGAALGLRIGIADHALRDNRRLRTAEQLLAYADALDAHPVLRGIEISLGETSHPDERWLSRLTHIIASLHSVPVGDSAVNTTHYLNYRAGVLSTSRPPPPEIDPTAYLAAIPALVDDTVRRWPVTILGHFALVPSLAERAQPADVAACLDAVARLVVQHDVAIEINGKSRVPDLATLRYLADRGVTFALGSDGHEPASVGNLSYSQEAWAASGLPASRLLPAPRGW